MLFVGPPARHFAGGPIQQGALGTAATIASGQRSVVELTVISYGFHHDWLVDLIPLLFYG